MKVESSANGWLRQLGSELGIALRYLRSQRRDASIRFLSRMTATGIAVGVGALILAMAGLAGMQSRLLADTMSRTPVLQVRGSEGLEADELADLLARLDVLEEVQSAQELRTGLGWLRIGDSLESVEIVGLDGALPEWMPSPSVSMDQLEGVLLPRQLSARLGLSPEVVVELISPRQRLGPLGPQPSTSFQKVVGAYDGGKDETRRLQVAVPLEVVHRLFGTGELRVDITPAEGVAESVLVEQVGTAVGEAGELVRWQDENRGLLFVLRLEKTLVFIAVALIVLVASFALVAAVSMIVSNKKAEIGILGTIGLSPRRVRRLFTLVGGLLAVVGATTGCVLGIAIAVLLDTFELVSLPLDVYIVHYVPFQVRPSEVAFVLLCTFIFTLTAAHVASRRASQLDPIEALRK